MKTFSYVPHGVCVRKFNITVDDGKILKVESIGGCNGNLKGIDALLQGMSIEEAIKRLDGIKCMSGGRGLTSCPDQIAQALKTL